MNVLVERSGSVTTGIINRPELRNAVDEETASQLLAASNWQGSGRGRLFQ